MRFLANLDDNTPSVLIEFYETLLLKPVFSQIGCPVAETDSTWKQSLFTCMAPTNHKVHLLKRNHQNTGELGYDGLNGTRKIGPSYAKSIVHIHMTNT